VAIRLLDRGCGHGCRLADPNNPFATSVQIFNIRDKAQLVIAFTLVSGLGLQAYPASVLRVTTGLLDLCW
jgi:hypothetical protein